VSAPSRVVGRRFTPRSALEILRAAFLSWREDKADRLSAALAYYTLFSVPPFLILIIGAVGSVFDAAAVQARLILTVRGLVGREGAEVLAGILRSVDRERNLAGVTGIGLATLLLGASGVFGHLKDSLNTVWEIEPKPRGGLASFARRYFFSMMVFLGTGFLLLVSLALNALLAAAGDHLARVLPGGSGLWQVVNTGFSLGVIAVVFALLYKYIPDAIVAWKDALLGGACTSVLFLAGEGLIGFYLGRTNVGSAFGVAGSLVVLLVWVYYSALIFFFGAELTKVYADRYGSPIRPGTDARPATEKSREQQGIPKRSS
jgi:membrane protein